MVSCTTRTKKILIGIYRICTGIILLSEIDIIIVGRYSVFPAIVVDEGSPVVVIQQGLHAKGGGDPKRGAKTCIAS